MIKKKEPNEIAAKLSAAHQRNVERAGPALRNSVLGEVVADILESDGELSIENIGEAIRERIASSPSARGKLDVRDDIYRAPLEHALALVNKENQNR